MTNRRPSSKVALSLPVLAISYGAQLQAADSGSWGEPSEHNRGTASLDMANRNSAAHFVTVANATEQLANSGYSQQEINLDTVSFDGLQQIMNAIASENCPTPTGAGCRWRVLSLTRTGSESALQAFAANQATENSAAFSKFPEQIPTQISEQIPTQIPEQITEQIPTQTQVPVTDNMIRARSLATNSVPPVTAAKPVLVVNGNAEFAESSAIAEVAVAAAAVAAKPIAESSANIDSSSPVIQSISSNVKLHINGRAIADVTIERANNRFVFSHPQALLQAINDLELADFDLPDPQALAMFLGQQHVANDLSISIADNGYQHAGNLQPLPFVLVPDFSNHRVDLLIHPLARQAVAVADIIPREQRLNHNIPASAAVPPMLAWSHTPAVHQLKPSILTTPVDINLATASDVELSVHGKTKSRLRLSAGKHSIDTTNLPVGCYPLRIDTCNTNGLIHTTVKQHTQLHGSRLSLISASGGGTLPKYRNVKVINEADTRVQLQRKAQNFQLQIETTRPSKALLSLVQAAVSGREIGVTVYGIPFVPSRDMTADIDFDNFLTANKSPANTRKRLLINLHSVQNCMEHGLISSRQRIMQSLESRLQHAIVTHCKTRWQLVDDSDSGRVELMIGGRYPESEAHPVTSYPMNHALIKMAETVMTYSAVHDKKNATRQNSHQPAPKRYVDVDLGDGDDSWCDGTMQTGIELVVEAAPQLNLA